MSHNFTDDPNSFSGPPASSSNTKVILIAIAIVCSTMMLICGGLIFGVVMTVRQAQQDFEVVLDDTQWEANQAVLQEYSEFIANGRYSEAIESVDSALESDPDNAFLHNGKAWLLATCPDDTVRDGELAIEHATNACELTNWKNYAYVDTIAAAYAEAGDFESAVKWQEEAIRLGGGVWASDFQRRLKLFKAGKAYREGVPPYKDAIQEGPAEFAPGLQPTETQPSNAPVDELVPVDKLAPVDQPTETE